jgi:hypothetical protein
LFDECAVNLKLSLARRVFSKLTVLTHGSGPRARVVRKRYQPQANSAASRRFVFQLTSRHNKSPARKKNPAAEQPDFPSSVIG